MLIGGDHVQSSQSGGRPPWLWCVLPEADDLGDRGESVPDRGVAQEPQPAVEQVGFHMMGGDGGLSDRQIGDEPGVGNRAGVRAGDARRQMCVER